MQVLMWSGEVAVALIEAEGDTAREELHQVIATASEEQDPALKLAAHLVLSLITVLRDDEAQSPVSEAVALAAAWEAYSRARVIVQLVDPESLPDNLPLPPKETPQEVSARAISLLERLASDWTREEDEAVEGGVFSRTGDLRR
ncbi:hypothetical protein OAX78_00555 [Planctomycetota bacterium]|nr:hypothetical protein [Planctomycetota bacterium]